MEIERKFLINNIENLDLTKYKKKSMSQDYLYFDRLSCIRKRKIHYNSFCVQVNKKQAPLAQLVRATGS